MSPSVSKSWQIPPARLTMLYISELVCPKMRPRTGLTWYLTKIGANVGGTPTNWGLKVIEVVSPGQNLVEQVHQVIVSTQVPKLIWNITVNLSFS